ADGHDTETAVRSALLALRRAAPSDAADSGVLTAGIHTGRILIRPSGEPERDDRFQGLFAGAEEMARLREQGCGVSASAARHVQSLFRFEPIPVSSTGSRDGALVVKEQRPPSETLGRFVGRKDEIRRLGEILWQAASHRAQVVTLRGPPGIGKTRLLYEAERRLRKDEYRAAVYLASCPPHGDALMFSGLTAMLQVLCGIREGDAEERIEEVEPRLRSLGLLDEEVAAVLGLLGATRKEGWTAAALRSGFARMVTSLCSDELHVFAWDSAQALDRASFEVLEHALERAAESRLVLIFALRDDAPLHPLEHDPNHHTIRLGELDVDETRELIARRSGVEEPPLELVEFCRERARGHPLFIEELIKELSDSGALVIRNRVVVELDVRGDVALPRPLRALVAARAARLPPDERRALSASAVLGEPIELATVAIMLGEPLFKVERLTTSLEEKGLVRRVDPGGVAFASPLLAEVVVDALPVEAQRQLHASAALALEVQHGDKVAEEADRLAAHLLAAGDRDGAALYLAHAAERKLAARQYDEATVDALRALELCDAERHEATELVVWLKHLAAAVYRVRTAHELPALIGPVLAHIDRTGDIETRFAARVELASVLVSTHEFDAADQCLQAAKALAAGHPGGLFRTALLTEAELARRRGDYLSALRGFEELSHLASDNAVEAHRVSMGLALCYAASGSPARAQEALARAEHLSPGDDVALACERAKLRQVVALMSRDFPGAMRAGETAVELAREAGLRYETAINLQLLAEALFRSADLPRAYATFTESAAICEEIAEERLLAHDRSFLAYLDSAADLDGSMRTLEESIAYAHAHRYVRDEVNARYLLARLQHEHGRADARAEFERCLKLARSVGFGLVADDCTEALQTSETSPA
ncbi:MAG TPA: AAA family ATPase, partial [Polyangiaceae bacterium]